MTTRNIRANRFTLPVVLAALLCLAPATLSQDNNSSAGANQAGAAVIHQQPGSDPMPGAPPGSAFDQMRAAERNRRIAADSTKLLQLSIQLKTELDKSPNQISVDALRKTTEIEKTAHDLKSWMTY